MEGNIAKWEVYQNLYWSNNTKGQGCIVLLGQTFERVTKSLHIKQF